MRGDLLHAMTARADALLEHLPGAVEGRARETHRARVAARRLAETLPLAGAAGERAARRVRDARRVLGRGREIDVTIDLLAEEQVRHDWPSALVTRVHRHLDTVAAERKASSRDELDRIDPSKLRKEIRAAGAIAGSLDPADVVARWRARLQVRESALARAIHKTGSLYDAERLHRVRIEVKKLRYVLELGADLSVRRSVTRLASLTGVQERLGRLHDLQMLQTQIRDVESRLVAGRGRVARGLARMAEDVEADCRAAHADVLPRLAALRRTVKA